DSAHPRNRPPVRDRSGQRGSPGDGDPRRRDRDPGASEDGSSHAGGGLLRRNSPPRRRRHPARGLLADRRQHLATFRAGRPGPHTSLVTLTGKRLAFIGGGTMANTPARVGMGVTAWTSTTSVDAEQRERAKAILGALGEELMVDDENLVDMATALSGTGPTYVFLLMEALVDAGVHLGFSRRVAEELVLRTVEGSALFARKSGRHLAELRNMVTSPGGTSAAAIYQ